MHQACIEYTRYTRLLSADKFDNRFTVCIGRDIFCLCHMNTNRPRASTGRPLECRSTVRVVPTCVRAKTEATAIVASVFYIALHFTRPVTGCSVRGLSSFGLTAFENVRNRLLRVPEIRNDYLSPSAAIDCHSFRTFRTDRRARLSRIFESNVALWYRHTGTKTIFFFRSYVISMMYLFDVVIIHTFSYRVFFPLSVSSILLLLVMVTSPVDKQILYNILPFGCNVVRVLLVRNRSMRVKKIR